MLSASSSKLLSPGLVWTTVVAAIVVGSKIFLTECQGFTYYPRMDRINPINHHRCPSSRILSTRMALPASYEKSTEEEFGNSSRRKIVLGGLIGAFTTIVNPRTATARYVLDEETGDYIEVDDVDWQTAWKQRMDKASNMSTDEIFQAARGAGNVELRTGPESDASKKRRAMSGCRDSTVREKAGVGTEKECTARVFSGEVDVILNSL